MTRPTIVPDWLSGGDVAINAGTWQGAAGTGNDRRPNRRFSVERQARRLNATGTHLRAHVDGGA